MAGLGRKVFTAGDVLTASDVQNYMMDQTVMNFAGTAARSSAIATPTDGMITYNQSNDQVEAYNGSAWVGIGGLQLIKSQAITAGVSTVTVTGAFNATYEAYKIIFTNLTTSAASGLAIQMGTSNTGYYQNQLVTGNYGTASGSVTYVNTSNTTSYDTGIVVTVSATGATGGYLELENPFIATTTGIQGFGTDVRTTDRGLRFNSGFHAAAISYTSFTFLVSGATFTGGTVSVYGYAKA